MNSQYSALNDQQTIKRFDKAKNIKSCDQFLKVGKNLSKISEINYQLCQQIDERQGDYFQQIQTNNILLNNFVEMDQINIYQQEQNFPENSDNKNEDSIYQSYTLNKEEVQQKSKIENNKNDSYILAQIDDEKTIKKFDKNIKFSEQFLKVGKDILSKLSEKNYQLWQKIDQGGEGEIYEGYQYIQKHDFQQNENKEQNSFKEQYIFKIYYDLEQQDFENEIKMMSSFEENTNFVQFKESIQGEHFHILVLQKCQYSLKKELQLIKKREYFSKDQFLSMIFDLLDALNQLRSYNILHLDIKPGNILKTFEGEYVFTDFGISDKFEKFKKVNVRGHTKSFAPQEQQKAFDEQKKQSKKQLQASKKQLEETQEQLDGLYKVTFKSDVYSLGKTYQKITNVFESANEKDDQNIKPLVKSVNEIIENFMIKKDEKQREDCLSIHKKLFKLIRSIEYQPFLEKYQSKIQRFVISMYEFDQNKDIPHLKQTLLYYLKKQLQIENLIQRDKKDIIYLRQQIASCYSEIGKIKKSMDYLLETLQIANSDFKQDQEQIANIHESIGYTYILFGQTEKSLMHSLKSLEIRKLLFQYNHCSIADSLERIGMCYLYMYEELNIEYQAKQYFKIFQFLLQVYQPDTTEYQNNQIINNNDIDDIKHAEEYLFESLEIRKQLPSKDILDETQSFHNIGYMYMRTFQPQKALKYFKRTLKVNKQIYEGHHPSISMVLQNIGLCHLMLYEKKEAIDYFKQSIEIEKHLFQDHIHFKVKSMLIEIVSNLYDQNIINIFFQITQFLKFLDEQSQKNEMGAEQLLQSLKNLSSFFIENFTNPELINDEEFYLQYNNDIQQVARFVFQLV